MTFDIKKQPNEIPWPPLIFIGAAFMGILLHAFAPLGALGGGSLPLFLGAGLIAAGLALDVWAMVTMARAMTNILPHRAADRLVTTGPFALTRNPIYVGNTTVLVGIGFFFANSWMIVAAIVAAFVVDRLAVRREEAHLSAKFGAAWQAYAARVPRWLGVSK